MQNQNQIEPTSLTIPQIRLLKAIDDFFNSDDVESVIKHLNSITTDAISLKDSNGDYWHAIPEIVEKVTKTADVVNFLAELAVLAKIGVTGLSNQRNIKSI